MKQVTLKFFIVPNSAWVYDGVSGKCSEFANFDYYSMKQFVDHCNAASKHGICCNDLNVSDMWAQVWVVSEEEDNCFSRGYGKNNPLSAATEGAPFALPVKFIENFKEDGDTFKTRCRYDRDGNSLVEPIEITWVAAQNEFRFKMGSGIAEALARVTEACKVHRKDDLATIFEKLRKTIAEER